MGVSWCRWVWHCILASIYVVVASLPLSPPSPTSCPLSSPFPRSFLSFYSLLDQPYFFLVLAFLFVLSFCHTCFHLNLFVHFSPLLFSLPFTASLSSSLPPPLPLPYPPNSFPIQPLPLFRSHKRGRQRKESLG